MARLVVSRHRRPTRSRFPWRDTSRRSRAWRSSSLKPGVDAGPHDAVDVDRLLPQRPAPPGQRHLPHPPVGRVGHPLHRPSVDQGVDVDADARPAHAHPPGQLDLRERPGGRQLGEDVGLVQDEAEPGAEGVVVGPAQRLGRRHQGAVDLDRSARREWLRRPRPRCSGTASMQPPTPSRSAVMAAAGQDADDDVAPSAPAGRRPRPGRARRPPRSRPASRRRRSSAGRPGRRTARRPGRPARGPASRTARSAPASSRPGSRPAR